MKSTGATSKFDPRLKSWNDLFSWVLFCSFYFTIFLAFHCVICVTYVNCKQHFFLSEKLKQKIVILSWFLWFPLTLHYFYSHYCNHNMYWFRKSEFRINIIHLHVHCWVKNPYDLLVSLIKCNFQDYLK